MIARERTFLHTGGRVQSGYYYYYRRFLGIEPLSGNTRRRLTGEMQQRSEIRGNSGSDSSKALMSQIYVLPHHRWSALALYL